MALWRIVVKNSGNAACKDKRQRLEKGMFIETSTVSPIPPIGVSRERPMLAQLFLNKYGIEINVNNMVPRSHFRHPKKSVYADYQPLIFADFTFWVGK